jgi:hypothetical protein
MCGVVPRLALRVKAIAHAAPSQTTAVDDSRAPRTSTGLRLLPGQQQQPVFSSASLLEFVHISRLVRCSRDARFGM